MVNVSFTTDWLSPEDLVATVTRAETALFKMAATPEMELLVIHLHRETEGHHGLGVNLRHHDGALFKISSLRPECPASQHGVVREGDWLVAIDSLWCDAVTGVMRLMGRLAKPKHDSLLVVARGAIGAGSAPSPAPPTSPLSTSASSSAETTPTSSAASTPRDTTTATDEAPAPASTVELGPGVHQVVMVKGATGVGFCLEGGLGSPKGNLPIAIKRIFKGGPAEKCGQLKVKDEILEVNGVDFREMRHYEAWNHLKFLDDGDVLLTVRRS